MFQNLYNHQGVADALKNALLDRRTMSPDDIAAVKAFEGAEWNPEIFGVLMKSHPGKFQIVGQIVSYQPSGEVDPGAIRVLLEQYVDMIEAVNPTPEKQYTKAEAISYLDWKLPDGMSEANFNYHTRLRKPPSLPPTDKIGRTPLWSQSALDEFAEQEWRPGPEPSAR